jgi:hypothetical protein
MPHEMRKGGGGGQASYTNQPRIRCVVRKRPMNKKEISKHEIDIVTVDSRDTVSVHEPKIKVDLTKYIDRHVFRLFLFLFCFILIDLIKCLMKIHQMKRFIVVQHNH